MNGFVGEFLILHRRVRQHGARARARVYTAIAATGVILSAVYMLWMFQRVNYGPLTNDKNRGLRDLSVREWCVIAPICAMCDPHGRGARRVPEADGAGGAQDRRADRRRDRRRRNARSPAPCREPAAPVHVSPARRRPARVSVAGCPLTAMLNDIVPIVPGPHRRALGAAPCCWPRRSGGRTTGCRSGWLGVIGLRRRASRRRCTLWDRNAVGFGVIVVDNYTLFFNVTICAIGLLTILISSGTAERDHLPLGEYYALMLFSMSGMMLMGSTRDLLVIFIALEIMSLGVYVMTGLKRTSERGRGGRVQVLRARRVLERVLPLRHRVRVRRRPARRSSTSSACASPASALDPGILSILAMVLLLVGFAFKVSAVPFHMWTPDAYQGAPTLVTGFMSTGVKAAAFAAFVRVFLSALRAAARRLGAGPLRHRRPDDDSRHGRRRRADERQAHARVFEHRARRLPARRPRRGELGGEGRDPLLSRRLRRDEPRRVRRARGALDAPIARTTTCATSPGCGTSGRAWRRC